MVVFPVGEGRRGKTKGSGSVPPRAAYCLENQQCYEQWLLERVTKEKIISS